MLQIKTFPFNSFQVNTYVIWDETKECAIIDAACYEPEEKEQIAQFITSEKLQPQLLINTHTHIDHILGNDFIAKRYNLTLCAHAAADSFLIAASQTAPLYGFTIPVQSSAGRHCEDGEIITFGNTSLKILYTPGHADGSICIYAESQNILFTGDLLFMGSVGRTDLPTGSMPLLMESIKNKLLPLPDNTKVYPGHGPATLLGTEKEHNPFLQ